MKMSDRDKRLIQMWRDDCSTQEICAKFEITRQRMHQILDEHEIPKRDRRISPASRRVQALFDKAGPEIIAALQAGVPVVRVAAIVGEPHQALLDVAHDRGLPSNYYRIQESTIDAWAKMYKTSSTAEISRLTGTPQTSIYQALKRRLGTLRSPKETALVLRTRKGPPKVPKSVVLQSTRREDTLAKLMKKLSTIK